MRVSITSIVHRAKIARELVSRFRGGKVDSGNELDLFQLPDGNDINSKLNGLENCSKFDNRFIVYY
jgi:hypothetical protein